MMTVISNEYRYCKIADLITKVPAAGDLVSRCREYFTEETNEKTDIILEPERFRIEMYEALSENDAIYLESGREFYLQLLKQNGMMLHSSAVELDGRAYLFSGNCGAGKSTHTRLWQKEFGSSARVFNDDKPALRYLDEVWYAYGTPWCGKDGININMKVPIAGICFLKQASENRIRRLSREEAVTKIISQTMYRFRSMENLDLMLEQVDGLVRKIPVFEMENRPDIEAVRLSYHTMRNTAEENLL